MDTGVEDRGPLTKPPRLQDDVLIRSNRVRGH